MTDVAVNPGWVELMTSLVMLNVKFDFISSRVWSDGIWGQQFVVFSHLEM